jgi:peptide chain release factor 1
MLPDHLRQRLDALRAQAADLTQRLYDPVVASDHVASTRLSRELAALRGSLEAYARYQRLLGEVDEAKGILAAGGSDADMRTLAQEQLTAAERALPRAVEDVKRSLVSEDPDAHRDAIVEIRPGVGGDEAALFASDLFRMYKRLADRRGWRMDLLDATPSEQGGFKQVSFSVKGTDVFKDMRYESGVHRVQRVPKTETQGRIHTSTATVAVLPEVEDVDIEIKDADVEMQAMRAGGPGGQNVNKTSSAVRLTHLPTGVTVKCQADPSQHKNRATAMRMLRAKLYEIELERRQRERSQARRSQIGGGDRSEKIRTYNFKENRVTDHRIGLTLHDLAEILDGSLDPILDALKHADQEERLEDL